MPSTCFDTAPNSMFTLMFFISCLCHMLMCLVIGMMLKIAASLSSGFIPCSERKSVILHHIVLEFFWKLYISSNFFCSLPVSCRNIKELWNTFVNLSFFILFISCLYFALNCQALYYSAFPSKFYITYLLCVFQYKKFVCKLSKFF